MPFVLAACGLLIAALALLLIGIPGGGGKGGGPLSPVAEAAEHTASVAGARFEGTGSGSFGTGSVQMSFDGRLQLRDRTLPDGHADPVDQPAARSRRR